MYPGYLQDRKYLGFAVSKDTECGTKLVLIINQFGATFLLILKKPKNQIRKFYVQAMLIFSIGTTILPVAGPSFAVVYPVPQQIVTVTRNRNDLNSILSKVLFKYEIATSNISSREITLDDLVLKLRAAFIPTGFEELPESTKFSYDMEQGRGLKNQARKVWQNPKAKKEILSMLEKFDKEDREIQEKSLKGFRKLTELKNSGPGPRVFVYRGKNEKPTVVGFCMRNDLDATIKKLKNKFN